MGQNKYSGSKGLSGFTFRGDFLWGGVITPTNRFLYSPKEALKQ